METFLKTGHITVARCRTTDVVAETAVECDTIGLVVFVSFGGSPPSTALITKAAKAIIKAPVVTLTVWGDGKKPIAMEKLLSSDEDGDRRSKIFLVPQANLIGKLKGGKQVRPLMCWFSTGAVLNLVGKQTKCPNTHTRTHTSSTQFQYHGQCAKAVSSDAYSCLGQELSKLWASAGGDEDRLVKGVFGDLQNMKIEAAGGPFAHVVDIS